MPNWDIQVLKAVSRETMLKAANDIGKMLVYEAQKKVSENAFNTGMLQDSIHYRVEDSGNTYSVYIGSNLDYAPYVEFGTGIYGGTDPINGQYALGEGRQTPWAWFDPSGKYTKDGEAGWVFTRGMKPRPYLYPAILENKAKIMRIVGKAIQKELNNV